jgi:BASS family bile acid:Na+ symporter
MTMADVTTLLALASLPLIAGVAIWMFYSETARVEIEVTQVLQIFAIAILPALIGAFVRSRRPAIAARLERPVKLLSTVFLLAVILFALVSQRDMLASVGTTLVVVALIFNLAALAHGYVVPRLMGVDRAQAVAVASALSIRNMAIVITIALSPFMLNDPELAVPPAVYGLVAYLTSAVFIWLANRSRTDDHAASTPGLAQPR